MADTTELIGRIFDSRYQITEQVGRGGMGAVYKAIHVSMNQVVALKVLSREMSSDDKQMQRFYHEARASSRLKHPNTIKVFDFGLAEEGRLYLAMEYLEGLTLTQLLRSEKVITIRRAIGIAKQVTKSLAEAHMNGLVHRDLKPDNVFITQIYGESDFVKVLDFGIAKFLEGNPEHERLTQAGLVCGTPLYISPEQALGKSLDGRSDLYSLGVILYEMLSGSPPFRADTPVALVMRHIHDQPPSMSEHRPGLDLPDGLRDLIFRLLDKDRDARHASAEALLQALDGILIKGELVDDTPGKTDETPAVLARGGNTLVETSDGEIDTVEVEVDDEAETAFMPAGSRGIAGNVSSDDELISDETIVLSTATSDDEPIRMPADAVEPPSPPSPPEVVVVRSARKPIWPWLAVGFLSLVLGGGMAAYGLGLFWDEPVGFGRTVDTAAPVPAPKPVEPAPAPVIPEPPPVAPRPRTLTITLETVPPGADVVIDGKIGGVTPLHLTMLEGADSRSVVFKSDGYHPASALLEPKAIIESGQDVFRYELERKPLAEERKIVKKKVQKPLRKPRKKVKKSPPPEKSIKAAPPKKKPSVGPKSVLNWE